jgi:hypothetical protein
MLSSGDFMTERKKILERADEEIDAFEKWFRGQGAEPLAKFERAIIKSFIVAKESGKFSVEQNPTR